MTKAKKATITPIHLLVAIIIILAANSIVSNTIWPLFLLSRLPVHQVREEPSPFEKINVISDVTMFSSYEPAMAVTDDAVLFVGYIKQENKDFVRDRFSNPDLSLFSLDFNTGSINWQAEAEAQSVVVNDNKAFVALDPELSESLEGQPTSVVAYDLISGDLIWQTHFDYSHAISVNYLSMSNTELNVRTNHRNADAFYILDMETGEINSSLKENVSSVFLIEDNASTFYSLSRYSVAASGRKEWSVKVNNDCNFCWLTNPVITDHLILVKVRLSRSFDPSRAIGAINRDTGSLIWRIEKNIISNIAIDGQTTFFLTGNAELLAVNTETGETLASLHFTPNFPDNFDFVNSHFQVAAHNNIITVYFGDGRQLFVFRFANPSSE